MTRHERAVYMEDSGISREVQAVWQEMSVLNVTAQGTRDQPHHDWMSMHEASVMIGVSPATLRRWSDAGKIKTFTTPGGHRRFSHAAVVAMLPSDRAQRPNLERMGETPERIIRIYRRELERAAQRAPWIDAIDDADRTPLREHGQRIAGALLTYFDATRPADRAVALATAADSAGTCGWIAGKMGLPIEATVEAFLQFRMPFIRELGGVARRRGFDTTETTILLLTATEAMDQLLTAAVRGHERAVRLEPDHALPVALDR